MKNITQSLIFSLCSLVFSVFAFGAPGDLDSTFGTAGSVIDTFGINGNVLGTDLIIQPSGKIVVAGQHFDSTGSSIALARYSTSGVLDTTFGTNGWTIADFGYSDIYAFAAAAQPDDKIDGRGNPCCSSGQKRETGSVVRRSRKDHRRF